MIKKGLIVFSIISMLSLAGCGVREKIGEKVTEKVIEKADGVGKVDIDQKKGKVTIEGDDGGKFSFGATEWPEGDLAESIPKFEEGVIVSVMEMPNMVIISIDEVESDDFGDYLETIKEMFSTEAYQVNSEGYFSYAASDDKGKTIQLSYSEGTMSLSVMSEDN